MFLALFKLSKLSGSTLMAKIQFPGKIVQVRVNGGSNFQESGQCWAPKLQLNVKKNEWTISILEVELEIQKIIDEDNPWNIELKLFTV